MCGEDNIPANSMFTLIVLYWSTSAETVLQPLVLLCRLNALEYSDLKAKLQAQVKNARNIVVRQSLSDQFLAAFHATVSENPVFTCRPHLVSDLKCSMCTTTRTHKFFFVCLSIPFAE